MRNNDAVSNGNSNPLPLHQVTRPGEASPKAKIAYTAHPTVRDSYSGLVLRGSEGEVCVGGEGIGEKSVGMEFILFMFTIPNVLQRHNQFSKGVISNAGDLIDRCLVVQKWRQAHCIGEFVFLDNLPAKRTMPAKRVANTQYTS